MCGVVRSNVWERSSGTVNSTSAVGFQEWPRRLQLRGMVSSIRWIYIHKEPIERVFKREGKVGRRLVLVHSWDKRQCTWSPKGAFNIVTVLLFSWASHSERSSVQTQVFPPQSMRAVDRCTSTWPATRARRWTSGTSWRGLQRSPEVTGTKHLPSLHSRTALTLKNFIRNRCLSCVTLFFLNDRQIWCLYNITT